MRTLCRLIFCGLAVVSFAVFIITQLSTISLSTDAIQFVIDTVLVTALLLGLIWLARWLWEARDVIGRIILVLLMVLSIILIAIVPELQQWAMSCLNVLAEQPLLITVLCVIMCAWCSTGTGQQTS